MTYGAIETYYAGCRFRSRLEARWAVFFDALDIDWQYEPQGFEMKAMRPQYGDELVLRWLPDFYLPSLGMWVEVKGSQEQLDKDIHRIAEFATAATPIPNMAHSQSSGPDAGILLLGQIPRWTPLPIFPAHTVLLGGEGTSVSSNLFNFASGFDIHLSADSVRMSLVKYNAFDSWWLETGPNSWVTLDGLEVRFVSGTDYFGRAIARVFASYDAARQARFEHGQRGAYAR